MFFLTTTMIDRKVGRHFELKLLLDFYVTLNLCFEKE